MDVSGELDGSSANSTAASTFVEPAPAPINPAVGMNVLVTSSTAFTSYGFRCDRWSSSSATSPLTTPDDMLVPDSCITAFAPVPLTWFCGYVFDRYESPASADAMWCPGAARSGLMIRSYRVGPFELYAASVSSDRAAVPCVSIAPTAIAYGLFAGVVIPPYTDRPSFVFPKFPAAATTVMPAFTARSTASHSGSSRYGCSTGAPSDRLMTPTLYSCWCAIVQSIASITSLTVPDPSSPST